MCAAFHPKEDLVRNEQVEEGRGTLLIIRLLSSLLIFSLIVPFRLSPPLSTRRFACGIFLVRDLYLSLLSLSSDMPFLISSPPLLSLSLSLSGLRQKNSAPSFGDDSLQRNQADRMFGQEDAIVKFVLEGTPTLSLSLSLSLYLSLSIYLSDTSCKVTIVV